MNSTNPLEGNWDAYEDHKKSQGQDPNIFTPENVWELNYLVDLIISSKPHLDHLTVMLSVREGMRKTIAPRPRQRFLEVVMSSLRSRELKWLQMVKSITNGTGMTNSSDYTFSFN